MSWRERLRRVAASGQLRELLMFLLVGGTGALIYVVLNVVFVAGAGMRPSLAILLTLAILIPPTYLAQRRLTFQSERPHSDAFPRYIGTQVIGNGIGLLGAELFPDTLRAYPLLAFGVTAVVVASTNYACLKFWAFRRAP